MNGAAASLANERVLVTGSGGVLGTALLQVLQERGADRVYAPRRGELDLLDQRAVLDAWAEFAPTLVFHLAGWVAGVQGNVRFAGQAFFENSQINLNVIEASRRAGTRKLVAAGTTAIYSDQVSLPMKEDDLWLGAPHGTEAAYGHAKRAMLAQLQAYKQQYGLDYGYMICTNLFGPNDRFDEVNGHVVPSLITRFHHAVAIDSPEIVVWGDGTPTRDFLYAADAARAFTLVAESGSGAYNTATGSTVTIRQLVEVIRDISGFRGAVAWNTTKPKGQQERSYDTRRLAALGWRPTIDLNDGLRHAYAWYEAHAERARR